MSKAPNRASASKPRQGLPKGIVPEVKSDGTVVYIVTVRSGKDRRQYRFADIETSLLYRERDKKRAQLGEPPFTKDEFLEHLAAGRPEPGAPSRSAHARVPHVGSFVAEIGATTAEGYQSPESFESPLNIFKRFLSDQKVLSSDGDAAAAKMLALPAWLVAENYGRGTQGLVVSAARCIWTNAKDCGYVRTNPFDKMKRSKAALPERDRRGRPRDLPEAPAWTPEQLVAMARLLRPEYVIAFWLALLLGLRRSELAGLRLGDWEREARWISVLRQRKASPAKGTGPTKTTSGTRPLPVGRTLAAAIDRYIAAVHGEEPTDPVARAAWNERFLLVGVKGGPMDQASLCAAVAASCRALGLVPEVVGKFSPLHHLRKVVGAVLQSPGASLSGRAVSDYLGHKTAAAGSSDDTPARITREHYSPTVLGELERVRNYLDSWVSSVLVPLLGSDDLLELNRLTDGITLEEAARRLSAVGEAVTEADVRSLVGEGVLAAEQVSFTAAKEAQVMLVSAADVDALQARAIAAAADSYSATEVAALMCTDHPGVYRLAERGQIFEVTVNARSRRARHGSRGGCLPGGGRRFDKRSVDCLAERDAERIEKLRTWLKVGEAAALLEASTDTVRRLIERGELVAWRDPTSYREERRICPESLERFQALRAWVTIADAATELGCPAAKVRALLRIGRLEVGPRRNSVLASSLATFRSGGAA